MTINALRDGSLTAEQASRYLVGLATRAPSVHNTQPWRWRIDGDVIELYADMSRRLVVEDPLGRNLVISCGAALHHLQVAANAFGRTTAVNRVPDVDDPTLLARVRVTDAAAPTDLPELSALLERRTDRRRFTSWPVPPERVEHLAEIASDWGVHAVALVDEVSRVRTRLLVETAIAHQAANTEAAAEQDRWIDRSRADGVPSHLVPATADPDVPTRFGPGLLREGDGELETSDGLIVLGGTSDDSSAWLRTGEGLSALWLKATEGNLSVIPLSQPVEVERTRTALRREILRGLLMPHLVVRVGWQTLGRGQLARSPRRPVGDVLMT